MTMSKRDQLFNQVLGDFKEFFKVPVRDGMADAPVLNVSNNKKFPNLNGRHFLAGYSTPNDVKNRAEGIAFVEYFPDRIGVLNVQCIIHISPTSVPSDVLGCEAGEDSDLTIGECVELFRILGDFLTNWKMEREFLTSAIPPTTTKH
jgi:hypothetical protein